MGAGAEKRPHISAYSRARAKPPEKPFPRANFTNESRPSAGLSRAFTHSPSAAGAVSMRDGFRPTAQIELPLFTSRAEISRATIMGAGTGTLSRVSASVRTQPQLPGRTSQMDIFRLRARHAQLRIVRALRGLSANAPQNSTLPLKLDRCYKRVQRE